MFVFTLGHALLAEPIEEIFICPDEGVTVLENLIYKAPASNTVCNRGTIISANTSLDPNYPSNEPFSTITAERVGDRYSKVTLNWKAGWTGTVSVTVFGNSSNYKGVFSGCGSSGAIPVITYKISRKNPSPKGTLVGKSQYTLGSDGVATDITYKGDAKKIRYKVNGVFIKTVTLPAFTGTWEGVKLDYKALAAGNYTFTVEELNKCDNWFSNLSKTVYVTPSCAGDDPNNIKFEISVPDDLKVLNGYKLNSGETYSISITGITNFDDNYTLSHNGGDAIQFNGRNFTINSEVGSYRIEATPIAGRSTCTVLNPIKIFVNGEDRIFPEPEDDFYGCPIVLPNASILTEMGYKTDEYQNFILEHFSLTLKSSRAIIIKPGIILENGAQLIVKSSNVKKNYFDRDKDVNYVEQIAYDEYRNVIGQSRAYFDERGRPVQGQYKNLSKNVVMASATLYDAYGRPVINTLSAPIKSDGTAASVDECGETIAGEGVNFAFQSNFVQDQQGHKYNYTHFDLNKEASPAPVGTQEGTLGWYYSNQNGSSSDKRINENDVANTQYPYTRMLYHHDGSGEVKGTALPGDYHHAGSGHVATMQTSAVGKDTYIERYFIDRNSIIGFPAPTSLIGLFFKREMTDVNGYRTVVYFDQSEQTLVTLYFGDQATPLTTSHQYYDYAGRLVASKDPKGLITRYSYDIKGRLMAMEEPDAGRTEYIYRRDGSIRFSQNAEQRLSSPARFSYTNYDRAGRATESGEYAGNDILFGSQAMKNLLENKVTYKSIEQRYSDDDGLKQANKQDQVFTYYDGLNPAAGAEQQYVKGSVSYSEKPGISKTWYSYDERGRVVWMEQYITGLGNKRVDYRYGHQGNVSLVAYQSGESDAFYHHYQYNADGQLEKVFTSNQAPYYNEQGDITNTDDYPLQASYIYYLHGPLKQVTLAKDLQQIDYYYTVQGWLKAINNPAAPATDGVAPDVFTMQLDYFAGDYANSKAGIVNTAVAAQDFSGNIQMQSWQTKLPQVAGGGIVKNAYQYSYDNRYQLQSASFGTVSNNTFQASANQAYNVSGLSYDKNGNITGLQRRGATGNMLHNFQDKYQYKAGKNQLESITGYKSYVYNSIGQMTEEIGAKGSQNLSYDVTGKVTEVKDENDLLIAKFVYDDRGFRVNKQSYDAGSLTKTTYYVRDASGNLMSTYEKEGNAALAQTEVPVYGASRLGLYDRSGNKTDYELKDHLGNVRAIIGKPVTNGIGVDVKYYADYYPFGSIARSAGMPSRFGFQGEFAEDETEETGYVSFELRQYDPIIGRWLSPDPMRQYASPYLAMGNNPVNVIDPTGGFGGTPCTGDCDYDPSKDPSQVLNPVVVNAKPMNWAERMAYDMWNWQPPGGVVFYNEFADPAAIGKQIGTDRNNVKYVDVWYTPMLPEYGSMNNRTQFGNVVNNKHWYDRGKDIATALDRSDAQFNFYNPSKPALQPSAPTGTESMEVHQTPILEEVKQTYIYIPENGDTVESVNGPVIWKRPGTKADSIPQ